MAASCTQFRNDSSLSEFLCITRMRVPTESKAAAAALAVAPEPIITTELGCFSL